MLLALVICSSAAEQLAFCRVWNYRVSIFSSSQCYLIQLPIDQGAPAVCSCLNKCCNQLKKELCIYKYPNTSREICRCYKFASASFLEYSWLTTFRGFPFDIAIDINLKDLCEMKEILKTWSVWVLEDWDWKPLCYNIAWAFVCIRPDLLSVKVSGNGKAAWSRLDEHQIQVRRRWDVKELRWTCTHLKLILNAI